MNNKADDAQRRHALAFFGSSTPAKKPDAAGPVEVYEPPKDGQVKANMEADKKTEAGSTKSATTTPSTTKMSNDGEVRNIIVGNKSVLKVTYMYLTMFPTISELDTGSCQIDDDQNVRW